MLERDGSCCVLCALCVYNFLFRNWGLLGRALDVNFQHVPVDNYGRNRDKNPTG